MTHRTNLFVIIPANNSKPCLEFRGTFAQAQALTDIEMLCAAPNLNKALPLMDGYVDDNGIADGKPFNARAVFLFHNGNSGIGLLGDMLVCGAPDYMGDTTDIPENALDFIRHHYHTEIFPPPKRESL